MATIGIIRELLGANNVIKFNRVLSTRVNCETVEVILGDGKTFWD